MIDVGGLFLFLICVKKSPLPNAPYVNIQNPYMNVQNELEELYNVFTVRKSRIIKLLGFVKEQNVLKPQSDAPDLLKNLRRDARNNMS